MVETGYCPEHQAAADDDYRKHRNADRDLYRGNWPVIRSRKLERDPLCEMCEAKGLTVAATLVHHITPVKDGGNHNEFNLMSLCHTCHEAVHRGERWLRRA